MKSVFVHKSSDRGFLFNINADDKILLIPLALWKKDIRFEIFENERISGGGEVETMVRGLN